MELATEHIPTGSVRKPDNYYREYSKMFAPFKDKPVRILEIGVQNGGSLHMWQEYFPNAEKIIGIDIDQQCKRFESDKIEIYIGKQEDKKFIDSIPGEFDIVIDDGGHTMKQQQSSFKFLFPRVKDGGLYVIEDLHTSYWSEFADSGYQSTIEWLKFIIDEIHFWAPKTPRGSLLAKISNSIRVRTGGRAQRPSDIKAKNIFQEWIRSIYIADSICFIEKGKTDRYKLD